MNGQVISKMLMHLWNNFATLKTTRSSFFSPFAYANGSQTGQAPNPQFYHENNLFGLLRGRWCNANLQKLKLITSILPPSRKRLQTRRTDAPSLPHKASSLLSTLYNEGVKTNFLDTGGFYLVKLPMLRHIPRLGFYPKQVIVLGQSPLIQK